MSMFLPAKCVEEADDSTVEEVSGDLGEAAVPEDEEEEPRALRRTLLSPAASAFTARVKATKLSPFLSLH